jgi:hypothetical protein
VGGHQKFNRDRHRVKASASAADDGYVAVDAMVALMIIALAVVLSLQAVERAHQATAMADEARRARTLILGLLDQGPRTFTPSAGSALGFAWRLETQTTGLDRPIPVCRRAVSLQSRDSGRAFAASTFEACPAETSA